MNLLIFITLIVVIPVLLICFAVAMVLRGINNAGACYTTSSDDKSKGCVISIDKNDCSGKYFDTMSKCTDYMINQSNT
jgi:hypothetical protein